MNFGIALPNFGWLQGREPIIGVAQAAEELGFDSVWVADHVVYPRDAVSPYPYSDTAMQTERPPPIADALIALAVVAGCTQRIKLGTSVLVLGLRNPILTAKMVASLDLMSGGRVLLGIGTGWQREEYEVLRAPDFDARGAVASEWIAILRSCWTQEMPEYEGEHYSFPALDFAPQPDRRIPILVGGNAPPALRRAGRIGDGWLGTALPVAAVRDAIARVRAAAREAERNPDALTYSAGYTLDLRDTAADDPKHLVGTPDQVIERVEALRAVGLDTIELRLVDIRRPHHPSLEGALRMMERFASKVMPAFA
jgi:probable F420-dependent oxidoreductase